MWNKEPNDAILDGLKDMIKQADREIEDAKLRRIVLGEAFDMAEKLNDFALKEKKRREDNGC